MLIVRYDERENFPWIDAVLRHNGENIYLKAKLDSGAAISAIPQFWARELRLTPLKSVAKMVKTASMGEDPDDSELHSVYPVELTLLAHKGNNIQAKLNVIDLKRPYVLLGWDFIREYRVIFNSFERVLGIYEKYELNADQIQPV